MQWNALQTAEADTIAQVAEHRNLGPDGAVAGVACAMVESSLGNPGHGDGPGPSSRGAFQQMPLWGSLACRMDVACAAGLFYDALEATPWRSLDPWVAIQRVQRSEFVAGYTGEGSDGTEGWNYKQVYPDAVAMVAAMKPVSPQQIGLLMSLTDPQQQQVYAWIQGLATLVPASAGWIHAEIADVKTLVDRRVGLLVEEIRADFQSRVAQLIAEIKADTHQA